MDSCFSPVTAVAVNVATPDPSSPTNVMDDVTEPGAVGIYVIDTATDAPGATTVPTGGRPVTVNAADVIVPEPELPTLTLPKLVCGMDSSGVAGAPIPIRLPSLVPT